MNAFSTVLDSVQGKFIFSIYAPIADHSAILSKRYLSVISVVG